MDPLIKQWGKLALNNSMDPATKQELTHFFKSDGLDGTTTFEDATAAFYTLQEVLDAYNMAVTTMVHSFTLRKPFGALTLIVGDQAASESAVEESGKVHFTWRPAAGPHGTMAFATVI